MAQNDGAQLQPQTETGVGIDVDQKGLTRRQFLTYVLGGTGGFMATVVLAPMVGMALDPLNRSGGQQFFKTTWKPSDFNDKLPTHVSFTQHIDDGWNSKDTSNDVYVIKYQNKLMIMSHVCTHLGCHVNGSEQNGKSVAPEYPGSNWFQCPCHGSKYNVYGVPTPDSPAPRPLDLFNYKIESDGTVSVGNNFQRGRSNWDANPNPTV